MRPFLFLGTRAEDRAADGEYDAVLRFSGLEESECRRVRLERDSLADVLGEVDLDDWSGVILGGGPFNVSDPEELKSPAQRRAEAELRALALHSLKRQREAIDAAARALELAPESAKPKMRAMLKGIRAGESAQK